MIRFSDQKTMCHLDSQLFDRFAFRGLLLKRFIQSLLCMIILMNNGGYTVMEFHTPFQ